MAVTHELDRDDVALLGDMPRFQHDPLGFALYAFPWGVAETSLAHRRLEDWQHAFLRELGERLRASVLDGSAAHASAARARLIGQAIADAVKRAEPDDADAEGQGHYDVVQMARASGKGIGKSALVSILLLWAMSTFENTRGRITANTAPQLRTITWPELRKWKDLCITGHWFEMTGTAFYAKSEPDKWRIDALPWNETNPEAFAGLHNEGKRIIVIFDEASGIPPEIWDAIESTLTDANTEMIFCAFGNPTRNTGRFRELFMPELAHAKHWATAQIDSRTVSITNKKRIRRMVAVYGEDSDYVRVYVRGMFPRVDDRQFIGLELVIQAQAREAVASMGDALVLGCDIGRQGDPTVLFPRRGRDARTIPRIELRIADTMAIAARIVQELNSKPYDACFIDVTGIGWGVYDRVLQLKTPCPVFAVDFGSSPDFAMDEQVRTLNKRAEMWSNMRHWLRGGAIPEDERLRNQLIGPEYDHNDKGEIVLERKKHMKERGLESPNDADALATTFAYPVQSRFSNLPPVDRYGLFVRPEPRDTLSENWQQDPLAELWGETVH